MIWESSSPTRNAWSGRDRFDYLSGRGSKKEGGGWSFQIHVGGLPPRGERAGPGAAGGGVEISLPLREKEFFLPGSHLAGDGRPNQRVVGLNRETQPR